MRASRWVAVTAAFGLMLFGSSVAVAATSSPSASADLKDTPPENGSELTPEEAARQAAQEPYLALADHVSQISAQGTAGHMVTGQIEVSEKRYAVTWNGEVPPELIELAPQAAAQGINLEIIQSAHSREEVMAAAMELTQSVSDFAGMSVTLTDDGTGLIVTPPIRNDESTQEALAAAVEKVRARGIAVTFDTKKPQATDAGRDNDNAPH
ncbi:hypothetical protein [Microbacterium sp. TPD7012]|uniref:hypothetical protein n=1 Tax=Microbacterium sp. TPD7012 TaxID=2171975 RepID=UPI001056EEA8|nr:hypothetical protein [Microbacterium sp. TPD7012]